MRPIGYGIGSRGSPIDPKLCGVRVGGRAHLLIVGVFTLCACGGSGGGNSSSQLVVEPQTVQQVLTEPVQWSRDSIVLAPAPNDTFALARSGVPDPQSTTIQTFDSELTPVGTEATVTRQAPPQMTATSLCIAADRIGVGFNDVVPPELQPVGIILDLGNVRAASLPIDASAGESFPLNENTIGGQLQGRVACLSDGTIAAIWSNTCSGVKKINYNTYVSYDPPECASEPVNGLYLRSFAATGDPLIPMQLVEERDLNDLWHGAGGIAALAHDRVLVITGPLARVYDREGTILDEATLPLEVSSPMLSCSTRRCVAVGPDWSNALALIINPDDLTDVQQVEIKASVTEVDEPGYRVEVVPYETSVGCDRSGICLVTWRLVRETYYSDSGGTEELGMYAVALDAESGEFGAEAQLLDAASVAFNDEGPIPVAIADGEFATARVTNGTVVLGRVDVR